MRVLITGACGFVGNTLARALRASAGTENLRLSGIDNLSRPGSEINRSGLKKLGVDLIHGDVRVPSDLESIGEVDWVIDAAASPSVLAGVDGRITSRQVVEHNLVASLNLLEFCKSRKAGLILLSTSRVYSIAALQAIRVEPVNGAYRLAPDLAQPPGCTDRGIGESFATTAPISLYGATKLASEQLAVEYGAAFGFPVRINRCGVLAGAGQFGRGDQGIFSFWIHSWAKKRPLKYIGFGGQGFQVRDCLHPRDLVPLLRTQMAERDRMVDPIVNLGGGLPNSISLAQLSDWCLRRFGPNDVGSDLTPRSFDAPWVVMDGLRAAEAWDWHVQTPLQTVLDEIAAHAEANPQWLDMST